jgi:glycosyltransferase involved in cell wall biosynthesis
MDCSGMSRDKINIIIPIYNPHNGWEKYFIESLCGLEKELKETDYMVRLVNDGSTNRFEEIDRILERFRFLRYYSYPVNMGKGYAIRYGINISDADFYIYTDMDFPYGYQVVLQTYQVLKYTQTNIVIGTRDESYLKLLPFRRKMLSLLVKNLSYLITGFAIKDSQAGVKGPDNEAKKILLQTKTNGFLFELEFLRNSLKQELSYKMINITSRQGIYFTDFRFPVIVKEIISMLKILF